MGVRRIALVIPWFGEELRGGAEQNAYQIASRLVARGHAVEILTTACRSFLDNWGVNHLPIGTEAHAGMTIRRFAVDNIDHDRFVPANGRLLSADKNLLRAGCPPISESDEDSVLRHGIYSTTLVAHVASTADSYDAILGTPYLFGLVLDAVQVAGRRGVMMPCLHHEGYAYLRTVAKVLKSCRHNLFLSEGERELAVRAIGPQLAITGTVVGAGVEVPELLPGGSHRIPANPYFIYAGRRDRLKGVDGLIQAFLKASRQPGFARHSLVLVGPGERSYHRPEDGVIDLGLVHEQEKIALMQSALALINPSEYESFSRVIMESWLSGRPVLVHAACAATALAVQRCDGGWSAADVDGFAAMMVEMAGRPEADLVAKARNGAAFARNYAEWDRVMARIEAVVAAMSETVAPQPIITKRRIVQLLPGFTHGDAISNQARFIRDRLAIRGVECRIVTQNLDPTCAEEAVLLTARALEPDDILLYHHSIGDLAAEVAIGHPGAKALIWHNITPSELFAPWRPEVADVLELGRRQLPAIVGAFSTGLSDSVYNAQELEGLGLHGLDVWPLSIDPRQWNELPDHQLSRQFGDGRTNLLFVGRVAPNKRQDLLIEMVAEYRRFDPQVRLIIAGGYGPEESYTLHVKSLIAKFGLERHVVMTNKLSPAQIQACWSTAHAFVSMSGHEGFGVPLIEAMWWDLPVIAYANTAIPETLGDAGVLVPVEASPARFAATVRAVLVSPEARRSIILQQRRRRCDFLPESILAPIDRLIDRIVGEADGLTEAVAPTRKPGLDFHLSHRVDQLVRSALTMAQRTADEAGHARAMQACADHHVALCQELQLANRELGERMQQATNEAARLLGEVADTHSLRRELASLRSAFDEVRVRADYHVGLAHEQAARIVDLRDHIGAWRDRYDRAEEFRRRAEAEVVDLKLQQENWRARAEYHVDLAKTQQVQLSALAAELDASGLRIRAFENQNQV